MSSIYKIYLQKKETNNDKIYLFKNGNFYICLDKDAIIINKELGLKISKFSSEANKCGFPVSELDKYVKFLKLLNLEFEVVQSNVDVLINDIKKLDIKNFSTNEAINKLIEYKRLLNE